MLPTQTSKQSPQHNTILYSSLSHLIQPPHNQLSPLLHSHKKMKKWGVQEGDEIQNVLDKVWDLHDKLSDTIHSVSRQHLAKSRVKNGGSHSQFCRDSNSVVVEAKSLDSIRSALEHLEEQLEFFHTVQIQQRTERDAALARLEQSRIILALKLAEHTGKRYKVIDEAMAFIGDTRESDCLISPQQLPNPNPNPKASAPIKQRGVKSNILVRVILSSFGAAKRILMLDTMGGFLGNAALFAFSMVALLHLHQVTCKDGEVLEFGLKSDGNTKTSLRLDGWRPGRLDVRLARG